MDVGLSAITLYLASASSPVAASTMDPEPGSRAEEAGEAVAALGAAAAAALRDSARQVGEAPREGRPEARPGERGLLSARFAAGRPPSAPRLGSQTLAWREGPSRPPPRAAPRARARGAASRFPG